MDFFFSIHELEEHVVWSEHLKPLMSDLPEESIRILDYACNEMLNNAIEHSEGDTVKVLIEKKPNGTEVLIADDGVGIFKKIQRELDLHTPHDALLELCKGKLTTDPERHTGEGIFFTSRACREFSVLSGSLFFTHRGGEDWVTEHRQDDPNQGTTVAMTVAVEPDSTLKEVFDDHTASDGEFGFTKTHVPVKLADYGADGLTSRSKARRIINRFDSFSEVILDFEGVGYIGQGFADEIFRVFRNKHSDVRLKCVNTSEDVRNMIEHVLRNA